MSHDVFISYSSKNKVTADALCHALEQHKIKCWIAPRDIPSGSDYGDVIDEAIVNCKAFIIIFSTFSSTSQWVRGELNLAFSEQKKIFPYKIDDTIPKGSIRLMLNQMHWIEAYPDPESQFHTLIKDISKNIFFDNQHNSTSDVGVFEKEKKETSNSFSQYDDIEQIYIQGQRYYHGEDIEKNHQLAVEYFTYAAKNGYAEAQFALGMCYFECDVLARDSNKAIEWITKAAKQDFPKAQFSLGTIYEDGEFVKQDSYTAFNWCIKAANQGLIEAQYFIGLCYIDGRGVIQSEEKAIEWLTKAADKDCVEAQVDLACIFYSGDRFQDYNKSLYWHTRAANLGSSKSLFVLGSYYENGIGVEKNHKEAVRFYLTAANLGHCNAQFFLGKCYEDGIGVEVNYDKAILWHTKAANQDNTASMLSLGIIYLRQDINYNKAFDWFSKAANQDDSYAQEMVGFCYKNGLGTSQDNSEAIKWYTKAANKGNRDAQYELGIYYSEGEFVKQDYVLALKYYNTSASQEHEGACYELANMYLFGHGVQRNLDKAFELYSKSANMGYSLAIFMLGSCYKNGFGVSKDKNKALQYFKESSEKGCELGMQEYDKLKNNCFITTAVCARQNKPDDCYELNTIRWFRDNWLMNEVDGPELIKEYYFVAPNLVEKVNNLPNSDHIYQLLERKYINKCVELIEQHEFAKTKNLYTGMINFLINL